MRKFIVTLLNAGISAMMFYAYVVTGSSALLAEAFHNVSDFLCLLFSVLSKYEALSALLNGSFVIVASVLVMAKAILGRVSGGKVITLVSSIALIVNIVGWALLRERRLDMRAMRLHLAGDALFSGLVVLAGLAVSKGVVFVDKVVAMIISSYMFLHGLGIVKESLDKL